MCSNWAPQDLVKHVVLTEFLLKILRESDLSWVFPLLLQLSSKTGDLLHFRLYFVSNTLDKHKWQIRLGYKKVSQRGKETKELSVLKRKKNLVCYRLCVAELNLDGRPTIGLHSFFSTELSHVQWGIPQTRNGASFHHVEHGRFVEYLSEWCHLFYTQAYRPTDHSR